MFTKRRCANYYWYFQQFAYSAQKNLFFNLVSNNVKTKSLVFGEEWLINLLVSMFTLMPTYLRPTITYRWYLPIVLIKVNRIYIIYVYSLSYNFIALPVKLTLLGTYTLHSLPYLPYLPTLFSLADFIQRSSLQFNVQVHSPQWAFHVLNVIRHQMKIDTGDWWLVTGDSIAAIPLHSKSDEWRFDAPIKHPSVEWYGFASSRL